MGEHYGVAVTARPARPPVLPTLDVVATSLRDELAAARARNASGPVHVLDVGGGSGAWAVPLAVEGCEVTVVDSSANALAVLRSRARDAGVADRVQALQADVDALPEVTDGVHADLVLGHGLLEYVDDPATALRSLADAAAPGGLVSLLVANRYAAVLARVVSGRVGEARRMLADPAGRWGPADQLLRRMDTAEVTALVDGEASLTLERVQGHRVLADLVPEHAPDAGAPDDLAALEELAATTPPLRDLASRIHVLARRAGSDHCS
jgi:S-adenosylmethionine-dependent methyltransferase